LTSKYLQKIEEETETENIIRTTEFSLENLFNINPATPAITLSIQNKPFVTEIPSTRGEENQFSDSGKTKKS